MTHHPRRHRGLGLGFLLAALAIWSPCDVQARWQASQISQFSQVSQVSLDAYAGESRVREFPFGVGCPESLSYFYQGNVSTETPYKTYSITKGSGYAYVALHFLKLWMPPGSSIILRGVEAVDEPDVVLNLTEILTSGTLYEDYYAPPVFAKELQLEFYRDVGPGEGGGDSINDRNCFGVVIDWYYYVLVDDERNITPSTEATCASDNSKEAMCSYEAASTRPAYLASRAVARLSIEKDEGKTAACTGWLLGSQGHLVTNYHCVKNQAEASATTVEFMADGTSCSKSCETWGGCPGTVEAISTTLVRANKQLDYVLLKLQTNVNLPQKYGYLRLKATQGRVGQEIYIPQHPLHYGKRIASVDDFGNHITILKTSASGCDAKGYSYNGDTQGGSSGSPVIDAQDHGVVALHHCGQFCANTGIPSVKIISDLKSSGVLPADAVDPGDNRNTEKFPFFQPAEEPPPRVLTSQLKFHGAIQRPKNAKKKKISIDQFEFSLTTDAEITIDVLSAEISDDGVFEDLNHDCQATYMDAILFLYAKGNPAPLMVVDDDNEGKGTTDGSTSSRDPYLHTYLKAGKYILSVASMPSTSKDAYEGESTSEDEPELYTCVKQANYGSYQIEFLSSANMAFSRQPQAVDIPGTCKVPAAAICSY